ncbi:MAG: acetyl-CoA C-acetyltransferase [Pseudomonadota bacterium]|nr:acetyl-CoA C-acetyltransferase [Pseudomonadota bacterium]
MTPSRELAPSDRAVYLIDGARSPFLKMRGGPGPFKAAELAVQAARALLLRQPFGPEDFDEVILGCVAPGPDEANIARVASLRLGCGDRVPAWTVQRNCASGLQAIDAAQRNIRLGRSGLVLAGGVEAMSHAPILFSDDMVRWLSEWRRSRGPVERIRGLGRLRPAWLAPVIGLLKGLRDPVAGISMGQTAEILAYRFGIEREAMDAFALESHRRLDAAGKAGHLAEISPLFDREGNNYASDDGLRADTSMDRLAALKPVFDKPYGNVTAGNSAQVTDGAAWIIVAGEEAVSRYGLKPMARILDTRWAALDPAEMGMGPVHAATPILRERELGLRDVDYWEINEAFAAQVLACRSAWKDPRYCREVLGLEEPLGEVPADRLNVDGGGISLGHPVGASGARIVLHLAEVLKRERGRLGMASICIGGGQGGALLMENVSDGA